MSTAQLRVGDLIAGDFVVERPLASGGMGAVYAVVQQSTGQRRALKVMHAALADSPRACERFVQEAHVSARIASDHAVQVIAAGVDHAREMPWLAMEFLEGEDLHHLLERGALDPTVIAEVFAQLCHALDAAHRAGVVHLDLKPENVFLARPRRVGARFTVKVLDFGIARLVSEQRRSATVTSALGSPFWMAPEQAMQGAQVGSFTDVWALGLIAYRLFTGTHYWRLGNIPPEQVNVMAWVMEMMTEPLEPASVRAARFGVAEKLPAGFDGWFARCVDRVATRRFADAGEAWTALSSVLSGAHVAPPPRVSAPTQPSLQDPPRTRKRHVAAVVVGAVALWLLAGVGVYVAISDDDAAAPPSAHADAPTRPRAPAARVPSVPARGVVPCPEGMVSVPGGVFLLGSPEGVGAPPEHPQVRVTLQPYCIGRTEVTVAQYRACVTAGRCTAPMAWSQVGEGYNCRWGREGYDAFAVNCIDWDQARAYCASTGGALPTEAQWEFAARGADGRVYPWGNDPPGDRICWWGGGATPSWGCPAGSFPRSASPFGALDMCGGLSEWVADGFTRYDPRHTDGETPAEGDGLLRVIRDSVYTNSDPEVMRSARRMMFVPSPAHFFMGVRCVR